MRFLKSEKPPSQLQYGYSDKFIRQAEKRMLIGMLAAVALMIGGLILFTLFLTQS